MRVNQERAKAFTLVELIVVMAIIAILIALSVLGLSVVQRSVRDTQRATTLNALNLQVEAVKSARGVYPTANSTATPANDKVTIVSNTQFNIGGTNFTLTGPAINGAETNQEATDYCYLANGTASDYSFKAKLENGNETSFGSSANPCQFGTAGL